MTPAASARPGHDADLVVVGAGPAGTVAALSAARLGAGRVVLLEKAERGRWKCCAGGLGPRAKTILRELDLYDAVAREAYPIRGLVLTGPGGRTATLAGAQAALVLARDRLDDLLADAAAAAGVEVRRGTRVDALVRDGTGRVTGVRAGDEVVAARHVVLAAGSGGHRLDGRPAEVLLHGIACRFRGVEVTPGCVEMAFEPDLLPHYGWLFPEPGGTVNAGLCIRADRLHGRSLRAVFQAFLDRRLGDRLAGAQALGPWRGHPIEASVRVSHRASPGVLLAGEAAGLVDPATGEGIPHAMASGRLAALCIRWSDLLGWSPATTSRTYARMLRGAFEPGFRVADLFARHGVRGLDLVTRLAGIAPVRAAAARALAGV
ncbi:MAG: NAD(P)/FAD-dependent oxidoreductase [Deltaproteobacteria bacterium]|nr:NAD(P)/FAD-dependent oxidoreductase [Deltaproteobacteria bacterium]